ncbi:sugar phosphate isomerase/epimerase family protein [Caldivirga maquilingensis]|uniref:Xylose isomerase domain protein TIM barrel n=1 Tax=Caldivirga maquilingensis (strain ATCC 700844 / DSM 13496 / JCM 10307 / IC-167) TaxID=397948 RepID=A8MCN8_CALMQ|nr:sugar phosphate isomerase/epimerase family protein [Caldivirga maquilingensis]ABW01544.1 Xylose isomerase domain protein TIM barrel [Caldivirga maquilingensis IC-167]
MSMSISRLKSTYSGFIEGKTVDQFFSEYNVKFAAGTWTAGDFSDRFNRSGYFPNLPRGLVDQLRRVRESGIEGVVPIDAQFLDDNLKVKEDLINEVKATASELGLKIAGLGMDISGFHVFKLGSLTNPDPKVRELALSTLTQSLEIARMLGLDSVSLWLGPDGWDYSLESNYGKKIKELYEGLLTLGKEAHRLGIRSFGLEAKPKEPREGNLIIPTSHVSIMLANRLNNDLGVKLFGITIDYGHELMYAVEPAYTVYLAKEQGVSVATVHINTAKWHSNDEDRVVGTGDAWHFVDFLYALLDTGYSGWFTLDQFTYRLNPVDGLRLSKELFANLYKKALALYLSRDEFENIRSTGDQAKILDYVKRIMYGL